MKILVTGGAGFIGSHVTAQLNLGNHEILVLDAFKNTYALNPGPTFQNDLTFRSRELLSGAKIMRCDLGDKGLLYDLLSEFRPDVVIHLAAIPIVKIAQTHVEEARRNLLDGLANLLEAVLKVGGVSRFVYASSSMVYGDFSQDPMAEDGLKQPVNIYGGLKLAGEILSQSYLHASDTDCTIVRPSAVYGPSDIHNRVVKLFCESALLDRPLVVNNAAQTYLDFTYVADIAQGFVLAATSPNAGNEAFNITCGHGRSLVELVEQIRTHRPDLRAKMTNVDEVYRPKRGSLSINKAAKILGYAPQWSLERGIAAYLDHISTQLPRQYT